MSSHPDRRRVLRGTVRKMGLEGGVWALQLDDGSMVELIDAPLDLRVPGRRAEVEGTSRGAEVTVGMVGDAIVVAAHRAL